MDTISIAMKAIENRYGLLGLPAIRSPRFVNLIRGTIQLMDVTAHVLRSRHYAKSLQVSHQAGAMAATDFSFHVTIPAWYCYTESIEKFVGHKLRDREASAVSLTLVNGSAIHESLHVVLSRSIMTAAFAKILKEHAQPQLFQYLVNVVEDIKIESRLRETEVEELITFVDCKNEIFFPDSKIDEIVEKTKSEFGDDKSTALELLVVLKCLSRRDRIYDIYRTTGFSEVVTIMAEINSATDTNSVAEILFEIFKDAKSSEKARSQQDLNSEAADSSEAQKTLERYLNRNPEEAGTFDEDGTDGEIPSLVEVDVLSCHLYGYMTPSKMVSLKFGFVKKLKIARQILPSRSEPKTRGAKLLNTRLANIVTDGKIFSNHGDSVYAMKKKQPEFIILVDLSGSMGGIVADVLETVKNMSKAMREADIPHAVYGHTSHGDNDIPYVYHIYSYKTNGRTDGEFERRFENTHRIELAQNYDGYAIRHVAKKFNKKSEYRYMLVLSDGAPCAPHYEGSISHTMECIAKTRKEGIKVISMSLTSSVMGTNDYIYGKEHNVNATSQKDLETSMQKIIMGGK